jgi:hypothetical protein
MKEFVEKTGVPYEAFNVAVDRGRWEKLNRLGVGAPAACIGDRCVQGGDLEAVAELLGVEYDRSEMLSPVALKAKYELIVGKLCGLVAQIPPEHLDYRQLDRDRTLLALSYHAGSVMLVYLEGYDPEAFEGEHYELDPACPVPSSVRTIDDVIAHARDTLAIFERWWDGAGYDDPLDRVIETYWGHRTLHEAFEREVWHTAQHTRQVAMFLEQLGLSPEGALTVEDLAGLPMPGRVHA